MNKKTMKTLMSSNSVEWGTPQGLFDELNNIYHFDLDVCSTPELAKCKKFFSPEEDGLKQKWFGVCFMNPPYGKEIKKWIVKAITEVSNGNAEKVVGLLPSRTGTHWFQDYILDVDGEKYPNVDIDCIFFRGRLKFEGAKNSAPFDSVLVIWDREM